MKSILKTYPTPPPSYFHRLVKPANRPYVFMGDLNEKLYEPNIVERYGDVKRNNTTMKSIMKAYDWENGKTKVELKSRNNDHHYYHTTMIGYNKVEEWGDDETDRRYYFLFGFLDGLYEWELTQDSYDAIGGYDAVREGIDYGDEDYTPFKPKKLHLYIPIDKLVKISDVGCIVPDDLVCKSKKKQVCGVCWIKL
jgi:hypothetical protein